MNTADGMQKMWELDWEISIDGLWGKFPFKSVSASIRETALKILQKWRLTPSAWSFSALPVPQGVGDAVWHQAHPITCDGPSQRLPNFGVQCTMKFIKPTGQKVIKCLELALLNLFGWENVNLHFKPLLGYLLFAANFITARYWGNLEGASLTNWYNKQLALLEKLSNKLRIKTWWTGVTILCLLQKKKMTAKTVMLLINFSG